MNPLLCRGFIVLGGFAGVYSRVIGMGAPSRSKACRWAGVGLVIYGQSDLEERYGLTALRKAAGLVGGTHEPEPAASEPGPGDGEES